MELRIAEIDTQIMAWHKANPVSQRLATIPGIGPLDRHRDRGHGAGPDVFRGGREFAAWLGLVPRQNSTGGKTRLGRISRHGDKYIRRLLIVGAAVGPAALEGSPVQCVDPGPAGPTTAPRGRRGSGQQDGTHRLGGDGAGQSYRQAVPA